MNIHVLYAFKPNKHWVTDALQDFICQKGESASVKLYGVKTNLGSKKYIIDATAKYIWLSLKVLFGSKKQDVIVGYFDYIAIVCCIIGNALGFKRKYVGINILLQPEKTGLIARINKKLYKRALCAKNFKATVTSQEVGNRLNLYLGTNVHFFILHDHYKQAGIVKGVFQDKGKSIFCGGRNGRNWKLFFNVAKLMSDTHFTAVMSSRDYQSLSDEQRNMNNITIYKDVSNDEFFNIQDNNSLIFLPLSTDAAAGLIVLFRAALNKQACVITNTSATREYVENGKSGVLIDKDINAEQCAIILNDLLNNVNYRRELCEKSCEKVKSLAAPEVYISTIYSIIYSFS